MTTPRQYSKLDDFSYKVDSMKEDSPKRKGDSIIIDDQQYLVIKTVDTNDKSNSSGYTQNGFQGMAVAPIIQTSDGVKADFSHTIIAYAGTNKNDKKDILTDVENVVRGSKEFNVRTGLNSSSHADSQFTSAEQFYQEVQKMSDVKIDSVTGHSLGGALAQKIAAAHHLPAVTFSTAGVGKQLTEKEKAWINGEGKDFILNFMHKGDQVSSWTSASKYGTAIDAGDFGNGSFLSGHMLDSYHFSKDGSLEDNYGGVWNITDKGTLKTGIDVIQKFFKTQMKNLEDLKSKLTASGGGLSSSEKIYLDSAQALAIVSTAGTEFDLAMVNVMKVYQDGIKAQEKLWQDTLNKAMSMGHLLETWEVHEALENTGFSHENIVAFPVGQYQNKISKVRTMSEQFKSLENQIKAKISELVSRDSELSQQLKG